MPLDSVKTALSEQGIDESVIREFLEVWPLVESILEAFSRATKLPIFAYLSGKMVFESSPETMPPFCSLMLSDVLTASRCRHDSWRRASKEEPDVEDRVQYCHAGMTNGRREIETGLDGVLTILFGAKPSSEVEAVRRRTALIETVAADAPGLASQLRKAETSDQRQGVIEESDSKLMDAIAEIIKSLLRTTVSARAFAINMAHELSLTLLTIGLLGKEIEDLAHDFSDPLKAAESTVDLTIAHKHLLSEARLGLYVVRNFLSHTSEHRYGDVVSPKFQSVRLGDIVSDMVELYQAQAVKKQILFDVSGLEDVPAISGSEMELRRLLHNVLNNAVKYSYHSVPGTQRSIRIRTRVPYDPGFRQRRFAIVVENYGLGLFRDEVGSAFRAGFRGRQAAQEVPVGAGIGLSEARKIMKIHNGDLRLRSEELYDKNRGGPTFRTNVELIFPYAERFPDAGGHR